MAAAGEAHKGYAASFSVEHSNFLTLLITTPVSIFLLHATIRESRYSGDFFTFIVANRPLVQLAVQIIANLLSIAQILVLCRLVNFAVRRRFVQRSMSLDTLKLWVTSMVPYMDWSLPWNYWIPLLLFMLFSTTLRGLWAAALTPVELWTTVDDQVLIPSWDNMTHVKEYPSEVWVQGPTLQNTKGSFSYSVGMQLRGGLLASASSATTSDGTAREHGKLDKSRYTYLGRSYGMGSTAGLVAENIERDGLALAYAFQEDGYISSVNCVYNETSDFIIRETSDDWAWTVRGNLPDSDVGPEYSTYLNNEGNSIVAIGVAYFLQSNATELPERRYLAFAAGESYDYLDKVQCEFDFVPTRFNVTVGIQDRNITVVPTNETNIDDIDPGRRLRGTAMRQFELIANDETNMYVSVVGTAFNASIVDLQTYVTDSGNPRGLNLSDIVLEGVSNSLEAMMDDMLGAYAAAQLVISDFTQTTPVRVKRSAIAFGELPFSVSVFAINSVIIMAFIVEVIRTKWWRGLPKFDMSDVRQIAMAASEGGKGLAELTRSKRPTDVGKLMIRYEGDPDGRYAIIAGDPEKEETTPIMASVWEPTARESDSEQSRGWNSSVRGNWI